MQYHDESCPFPRSMTIDGPAAISHDEPRRVGKEVRVVYGMLLTVAVLHFRAL